MFKIRKMRVDDFQFAIQITNTMDWDLEAEDFEFTMNLEPEGCFVIVDNSNKIGLATTVRFDGVGWLGNVIVSESHRGKGVGSQLVSHAIQYLKNKNVETVGLYAYLNRIPFYEGLGFKYDSRFTILRGRGPTIQAGNGIRAGKSDLGEILELDRLCFGASRRRLLEQIISDSANLCYVAEARGQLQGYIMSKIYDGAVEVGPLVCRRGLDRTAVGLLRVILKELEGFEITMCVPEKESEIISTLSRIGFSEIFQVARMFHGNPIVNKYIYMVESLERG